MASSFANQIPNVIHLVQKLQPNTILDIGKGFGKYAFLLHEYVGINNRKRVDPSLPMKDQSSVMIDAVEVDNDLMLPHLPLFYNKIFQGDVLEIYKSFPKYDLVLMIDIIEHIDKEKAIAMLKHFMSNGCQVVIATPKDFFEQKGLYDSDYEMHVSHWTKNDFKNLGYFDHQRLESGVLYLLSPKPVNIRGFGNSLIKKLRRLGRSIRTEL